MKYGAHAFTLKKVACGNGSLSIDVDADAGVLLEVFIGDLVLVGRRLLHVRLDGRLADVFPAWTMYSTRVYGNCSKKLDRVFLVNGLTFRYSYHGQIRLVPDDEYEHGQEDEVKTAEAVLEGHESKLCLDAAQVHLHDIHVCGVEDLISQTKCNGD